MLTSSAGGVRERGTRRRGWGRGRSGGRTAEGGDVGGCRGRGRGRRRGRGRGRGRRRRCAESDGSRAAADDYAGRRQRRSKDLGEVAMGEEQTVRLS